MKKRDLYRRALCHRPGRLYATCHQPGADPGTVFNLAVETYELGLEMRMPIGVFHHQGSWYALRNSCLHQRGPVCTGTLKGNVLTCPWHGFQAVYNVGGTFYATQSECTHANGPLEEGDLDGCIITCPLHDSRFDVTTGQVIQGPADEPLKTFRVIIEGEIGRVEQP